MLIKQDQNGIANDSHTKLLLHMNGANDGTVFTDSSSSGKTVTRYGALTKTATKKFGTASGYFDGTDDYLSLANSADFNFGTGDFTIDGWVNFNSFNIVNVLYQSQTDVDNRFFIGYYTGSPGFYVQLEIAGTSNQIVTSSFTLVIGTWYHIAVVRSSGTISIYINGTSYGSGSETRSISNTGVEYIANGIDGNVGVLSYPFPGYIDEVRISKGIARWTKNFSVPNRES